MGKIKIKKNVKKILYVVLVLGLFLSVGIYSFIKIYAEAKYEKTYEFKLLNHGYTEDEVNNLLEFYKNEEINYILENDVDNNYLNLIKDQYFIYDNFYTYLEYLENNKDIQIRDVVEIVNTFRNYDYYSKTIKTDTSKKELMLVNKYHYLDKDYEPDNLVTINMQYAWGEKGYNKINADTYNAFLNMWNDAYNRGFYLMISSSYRDYAKQEEIYGNHEKYRGSDYADSIAARPGYSEHQTGYVLDIFEKNNSNKTTFHETEAYLWLKENSYKYGFILRYPEDKQDITGYSFESWHYRYVGVNAATYIYQNNITFDEYYAYFVE